MISKHETNMAVTFDTNSDGNIHPANKQPVGERTARWALSQVYQAKAGRRPLCLVQSAGRRPDEWPRVARLPVPLRRLADHPASIDGLLPADNGKLSQQVRKSRWYNYYVEGLGWLIRNSGIDPAKARLHAPPCGSFQPAAEFAPGDPIPVDPLKGWMLVLDENPPAAQATGKP